MALSFGIIYNNKPHYIYNFIYNTYEHIELSI